MLHVFCDGILTLFSPITILLHMCLYSSSSLFNLSKLTAYLAFVVIIERTDRRRVPRWICHTRPRLQPLLQPRVWPEVWEAWKVWGTVARFR